MPRGPLPSDTKRRRNKPTIETAALPAAGRSGAVPVCPLDLHDAGSAWWAWAWKLPQAARWDAGALYFVARRAVLEDMAAVLDVAGFVDIDELLHADDYDDLKKAARNIGFALRTLKGMAGGKVGVMREMREIDNRLGLNPKAIAELRWSIESDAADEDAGPGAEVVDAGQARRARLQRVS